MSDVVAFYKIVLRFYWGKQMKDKKGLYYYPFPGNKKVRMYVREAADTVEFRLSSEEDSALWKDHGWVPYEAIVKAKEMYKGGSFDPNKAYDLEIAKTLIAEAQ